MSVRYLVFERPVDAKTWTIAFKDNDVPMTTTSYASALKMAHKIQREHRGWRMGVPNQTLMIAHIAKIELPE